MNRSKSNLTDKTWSLILVGNHGSIIPLGSIRAIMIGLILGLITTIISIGVLGYLYFNLKQNYAVVTGELEQKQEQLRELRDKRDMLMARLVIAESKLISENDKQEYPPQKTHQKIIEGKSETVKPTVQEEKNVVSNEASPKTSHSKRVEISNFNVSYSPQSNTIAASYILKNKSPGPELLSGKCVLLLKGEIAGEVTTYPVPNVPWENGIPSAKLGAPFYIRNFMTLQLNRSGPGQDFNFDRGIVYVFENSGSILLKKEFPVDLKYEKININ
ncbi:MAG: hypothetical protein PVI90_06350 [Desulfobacteraceae bacterium]|jgi:hypothetical protein